MFLFWTELPEQINMALILKKYKISKPYGLKYLRNIKKATIEMSFFCIMIVYQ